jgi:hypothetical protein
MVQIGNWTISNLDSWSTSISFRMTTDLWSPWKQWQSCFSDAIQQQETIRDWRHSTWSRLTTTEPVQTVAKTLPRVQRLLQGYGNMVRDRMELGWHGYFLSFMFSHIPGSDASRMQEMKKHLGWFYGRLAKASVPRASSPDWSEFLPKVILAPDLPVPKHSKQTLRDVTINDGLHWHGLVLVNPLAPKMRGPLDLHIQTNLRKYLVGSIRTIDVKPITSTPEYSTGYGLKSLPSRFSTDEIVIFPRSVSELPTNGPDPRKGPVRAAGEKPMYDFQRT